MPSAPEIYEALVDTYRKNKKAVLATITAIQGSVPQEVGAMMLFHSDMVIGTIGGGKLEYEVTHEMHELLGRYFAPYKKKFHLTKEDFGMECGGEVEIFLQPVGRWFTCHIFGAGHICLELYPLLEKMDFSLQIYDNRKDYALERPFPVKIIDYNIIPEQVEIQPEDCVIIITHSHKYDELCLKSCLHFETEYLGMIGSKSKVSEIFQRLDREGFSKEKLKKVDSPIGIPIPSHTPVEVAVSIAARMVEVKNRLLKEQAK